MLFPLPGMPFSHQLSLASFYFCWKTQHHFLSPKLICATSPPQPWEPHASLCLDIQHFVLETSAFWSTSHVDAEFWEDLL